MATGSDSRKAKTGFLPFITIAAILALIFPGLLAVVPIPGVGESPAAETDPPVANAGVDITDAIIDETVELDGTGSTDEEIESCAWLWECLTEPSMEFADMNSSTPEFVANVTGSLTIRLTLKDPEGQESTDEVLVEVSENRDPTAVIDVPLDLSIHIQDEPIDFSANSSSDPDGRELSYSWRSNISGVISGERFFEGSLSAIGWHLITLNVTDPNGGFDENDVEIRIREAPAAPAAMIRKLADTCYKREVVRLDGSLSTDQNPEDELNFTWRSNVTGFEELGYGPVKNVTLDEGYYRITLNVTDLDGLSDEANITIAVKNRIPVAVIDAPHIVNVTEPAVFSASGSEDPDGDTLTYLWDFDDGRTDTGVEPAHSWSDWGVYNVTLEIDDGSVENSTGSDVHSITVNHPPVAELGDDMEATLGEYFTISANLSHDEDEGPNPLTFRWDFDEDGEWDEDKSGEEVSHRYEETGTYDVLLEVFDGWASSTDSIEVTVKILNEIPVANAGGDKVVAMKDGQGLIELDASASFDPDDDLNGNAFIDPEEKDNLTYTWDIDTEEDSDDDGILDNDKDLKGRIVTLTIDSTAVVTVVLNVTDPHGLWDTDLFTVRGDNPPVISSVKPDGETVLVGVSFKMTAIASDPDRGDKLEYTWDMGDGTGPQTSESSSYTHTYQQSGTYNVLLIVSDGLVEATYTATLTAESLEPPTMNSPRNGSIIKGTITIRGSSTGVGDLDVIKVEIRVDDGEWDDCQGGSGGYKSWTYKLDTAKYENGKHTIEVKSTVSQSGKQVSTTASYSVEIDNAVETAGTDLTLIIIIAIVILIILILLFVIIKRRRSREWEVPPGQGPGLPQFRPPTGPTFPMVKPPATPSLPPAPEMQEAPEGKGEKIEEERDLKVRCPACGSVFVTADNGERPLHLKCTHCGAKGSIDEVPEGEKEGEGEPEEEGIEAVPIFCPSCDGMFELTSVTRVAKCPFCDAEGDLDDETFELLKERFGDEEEEMTTLKCPKCEKRFKISSEAKDIKCPHCGVTGRL